MYSKGDKIKLWDGSVGQIDGVVKTELKNIYRIIFDQTGEEGYFEEDKLFPVERSSRGVWRRVKEMFSALL